MIAGVVLGNQARQLSESKEREAALENTIENLNQEISYLQVSLNDSEVLYQAIVKDLSYTKDNIKSKYDELLKAMSLKAKDVRSVKEVVTVVHEIDTVYAEKDSFGGLTASLRDSFVNIEVDVMPDLRTAIDYEVRDSLTIINTQKRHSWLFGLIKWTEHKETRVVNHNPKAQITSLTAINVIE